uniref:Metallophosphoesterase 1 n=1 Tax=Pavo cristatus TaxID=9049 RepID=A0A8C9G0C9_PAVCR
MWHRKLRCSAVLLSCVPFWNPCILSNKAYSHVHEQQTPSCPHRLSLSAHGVVFSSFVLVNSVAMEGDGCTLCRAAEAKLVALSHRLNCSQQVRKRCSDAEKPPASQPILLQHYPLYRKSDAECSGEDAAPPEEKTIPFKEKYDVLSQEASQKLLWWFHPRLILSGHTHSACQVLHGGGIPEISVPSFSWRNRNNPSFIMVSF